MEITKLFVITYFAALVGVLPPGLVNMTVAKTCLQRGKKNGTLVAVGACVVVLFQALIAILLAKYIFNNEYVRNMLLRTGVVIFILMGIYFLITAKRARVKRVKPVKHKGLRSMGKGILISAINILPIPYFCALGAALNVSGQVTYHFGAIATFMLAAALGTFTALYMYVLGFQRIERRSVNLTKYTNYFMAALMLVLVILTLVRMYFTDH
ncbi:MAG: LysE family transporter [Leeuwenhoekiella sp.]